MPHLAANLSMLFTEMPFFERFSAAAAVGFKGVEYLFPYDFPADNIAEQLDRFNIEFVLFNTAPGDWQKGERGLASLAGREAEFEDNFEAVINYSKKLNCTRAHMMAGIPAPDTSLLKAHDTYIRNLQFAARTCRQKGPDILIEPINRYDMPGYFLNSQDQAIEILKLAGEPNIALQMDLYHCHMTEGNIADRIRENITHIGHFQIAGAPGRHEPDVGEIDYPAHFNLIDQLDYAGWVSCEYRPKAHTLTGLEWAAPYGIGKKKG